MKKHEQPANTLRNGIKYHVSRLAELGYPVPDEWIDFEPIACVKFSVEDWKAVEHADWIRIYRAFAKQLERIAWRVRHESVAKNGGGVPFDTFLEVQSGGSRHPDREVAELLSREQEGGTATITAFGETARDAERDAELNSATGLPIWNPKSGKLLYRGKTIRTPAGHAINVIRILEAFQIESWPVRIDDPLPGGKNPDRLSGAVRSLNTGLQGISFACGGDGESIRWEPKELAEN